MPYYQPKGGWIEIICGSMFSGKTEELIRRVRRAEIEHSILLERVHVEDLDARVESSLIGRDVTISRTDAKPRAYRFVLGDSSVIGLT